MNLLLKRTHLADKFTLGELYIDGVKFCYTVEDKVRDLNHDGDLNDPGETKIHGETAIPKGEYNIILTMSPHFGKITPRLVNVPGFDGVLIHSGNTAADSSGCIIIGGLRIPNGVAESRICFDKLMLKLKNQPFIKLKIEE